MEPTEHEGVEPQRTLTLEELHERRIVEALEFDRVVLEIIIKRVNERTG